MPSPVDADKVSAHRADLVGLTAHGGPIDAESPHASIKNPEWFNADMALFTPRRARMHREISATYRAKSPNVRRDKQAIFLAGPPGAGKTTAQEKLFESTGTTESDWRILNADDFKDALLKRALADGSFDSHLTPPEVRHAEESGDRIWPRERAALVHEESSILMKQERDAAIARGENIIIDGTLANEKAGVSLVKTLEASGYSIRVALVDGPRAVTAARVDYRWARGYENATAGVPSEKDPDVTTLGGRWVPAQVTDTLYPTADFEAESICATSAREVAASSQAVTQLDVYRITEPGGDPDLVEQRTGKDERGRWQRIQRMGDEHRRYQKQRAQARGAPPEASSGDGTPRCVVCGRPLRSAESIARGAGPTCAGAHAST